MKIIVFWCTIVYAVFCLPHQCLAQSNPSSSAAQNLPKAEFSVIQSGYGLPYIVRASVDEALCAVSGRTPVLGCRIGADTEKFLTMTRANMLNRHGYSNYVSNEYRFGLVPASARRIITRVLWVKEKDTLLLRTDTSFPKQMFMPANFGISDYAYEVSLRADSVLVPERTSPTVGSSTYSGRVHARFLLANIAPLHYPIPLDVDTTLTPRATLYAGAKDIDILTRGTLQETLLDYKASSLRLFVGNRLDTSSAWRMNAQTFAVLGIEPSEDSTEWRVRVEARNLDLNDAEHEAYSLQGTLCLRYAIKVKNRGAGKDSLTPEYKKIHNIRVAIPSNAIVRDTVNPSVEEEEFSTWLTDYIRTAPISKELQFLRWAKRCGAYIDAGTTSRIGAEFMPDASTNAQTMWHNAYNEEFSRLSIECDEASKIMWKMRHQLPIPQELIDNSSSPEVCEEVRRLGERYFMPQMNRIVIITDESEYVSNPNKQPQILCAIPVGLHSSSIWWEEGKQPNYKEQLRCALSPNNIFAKYTVLPTRLKVMPCSTEKRYLTAPGLVYAQLGKNVYEHLDSTLRRYRYNPEDKEYEQAWGTLKKFVAGERAMQGAYRVYEADSAALLRWQEVYKPYPPMGFGSGTSLAMSESKCEYAESIKKFALTGQKIPRAWTQTDASWDCGIVKQYYEGVFKQNPIARVLVFVSTSGRNAGLPEFVACTGQKKSSGKETLAEQLKNPVGGFLSASGLRAFKCQEMQDNCPVRGSMNTPYTTLYDYLAVMLRQGRLQERTQEFGKK